MSFLFVIGGAAALLFLIAYVRSGRFGATVLALGVGYLLALMWTDTLATYEGVSSSYLSWRDTVYSALIVVPGLLALGFSHKQQSLVPRIVAAAVVAALGVALLLPIFDPWAKGHEVYFLIEENQALLVTVFLLLGLFDVVFSRLPKAPKRPKD